MKIIENTYPIRPNVAHGYPGDEVEWSLSRGGYNLIRKSDNKTVFGLPPVDQSGCLKSNGKKPILIGKVAEVKSKGWRLVVQ